MPDVPREVPIMLRVSFGASESAAWHVSEDEFLARFDALAERAFSGAPTGKVLVEAIDERQRLQWRAHYTSAAGLGMLAREIREGRAAAARRVREP